MQEMRRSQNDSIAGTNGNYSSEPVARDRSGWPKMLKGGVINGRHQAEQARIAEDAGACAVMALERVPSDIRKEGGVARMAAPKIIREIMNTVKHSGDGQGAYRPFRGSGGCLRRWKSILIDESEVLTPADEENHVWKHDFKVPFVCGGAQSGRSAAAHRRRRGHDSHQRGSGIGQRGGSRAVTCEPSPAKCGGSPAPARRDVAIRTAEKIRHVEVFPVRAISRNEIRPARPGSFATCMSSSPRSVVSRRISLVMARM